MTDLGDMNVNEGELFDYVNYVLFWSCECRSRYDRGDERMRRWKCDLGEQCCIQVRFIIICPSYIENCCYMSL